jgi:AcrR family transcriptional regulator
MAKAAPVSRKEKAEATRQRIIAAAYDLFSTKGYAGTTFRAVAEAAGVAVQTVYFVFHTKVELLEAVTVQAAAAQARPGPVMDRPWAAEALQTGDARRTIALAVEYGVDIYARVGPIARVMRMAAMSDPDVDAVWTRISVDRKQGMHRLVQHIAELGALAQGLTVERGTDILHALNGHDTYIELVGQAGWDLVEYKRWLYQLLCSQLLTDAARRRRGAPLSGLTIA